MCSPICLTWLSDGREGSETLREGSRRGEQTPPWEGGISGRGSPGSESGRISTGTEGSEEATEDTGCGLEVGTKEMLKGAAVEQKRRQVWIWTRLERQKR